MRYKGIAFETTALWNEAPREALERLGVSCRVGDAAAGELFVGEDPRRVEAAAQAGCAAALALWRAAPRRHVRAQFYLRSPYDLVRLCEQREAPFEDRAWMRTAMEMQAIAQAGLAYSHDPYDLERFERLRTMAAEMLAQGSGLPLEKVSEVFLCESGYQTPKIDTRAAIVEQGRILLVQENTGLWALPGGWMDVGTTVSENAAKEAFEEAGLRVAPLRLIALLEHNLHNTPVVAQGIVKVFVLCRRLEGAFAANIETVQSGFFAPDALPPLAVGKTTAAQVRMCLDAAAHERWQVVFD